MLKDSLSEMILEGSQQFIAEIFLPLLNSFNKTLVNSTNFSKYIEDLTKKCKKIQVGFFDIE